MSNAVPAVASTADSLMDGTKVLENVAALPTEELQSAHVDEEPRGLPGMIAPPRRRTSSTSSSIDSLRRRRREDKQPEGAKRTTSPTDDIFLPAGDIIGGDMSDTESLHESRDRTGDETHSEPTKASGSSRRAASDLEDSKTRAHKSLDSEASTSDTSTQDVVPTTNLSQAPVPTPITRLTNSGGNKSDIASASDPSSPLGPPPPPKGNEHSQFVRNRGSSQGSNSTSTEFTLAQALFLDDPRNQNLTDREGGGSYFASDPSRSRPTSNLSVQDAGRNREHLPPPPYTGVRQNSVVLPRWQPDAEVTICPICRRQFGWIVRKHHCRKCGRVVCSSCSPHRITIPYQFIVQPPHVEPTPGTSSGPRPLLDPVRAGSDFASLGGGERVRLCNPCVPDPNVAPPQSPALEPFRRPSNPNSHSRSTSLVNPASTAQLIANFQRRPREASTSVSGRRPNPSISSSSQPHISHISSSHGRTSGPDNSGYRVRSSTNVGSVSTVIQGRNMQPHYRSMVPQDNSRPLPRPPRLQEEDECPVCHLELPSSALPNSVALREEHINQCIENAFAPAAAVSPPVSTRASVSSASTPAPPPPIANTPEARMAAREQAHAAVVLGSPPRQIRRTGVFPYKATEKDCIDDAECTICLEEFEVGEEMGRLECFCRFHLKCIRQWFELHHGQCPVHQHDGGY